MHGVAGWVHGVAGLQGCLDHGGDELLQLLRVLRRQRVESATVRVRDRGRGRGRGRDWVRGRVRVLTCLPISSGTA